MQDSETITEDTLADRTDRSRPSAEGLSEAERLLLDPMVRATAIAPEWKTLIEESPGLGRVKSVVRNAHAIHKSWGAYGNIRSGGEVGLVLNGDIDLRMFYGAWRHAFVVEADTAEGPRIGLETFDATGAAVQKVFPEGEAGAALLRAWAERFRACGPRVPMEPAATPEIARDDAEIDAEALLADWRALTDVHQFRALLTRHGVGRTQALRLAEGRQARRVAGAALGTALETTAARRVPIMVFVANPGIVQIHSGPVGKAVRQDGWINLTDPGFHLHVREAGIAESWVVTKPTGDGDVTSLELYDGEGEAVLQMFGVRREGQPEREDWRALLAGLPETAR